MTTYTRFRAALAALVMLAATAGPSAAQDETIRACYVPDVGAMYLIELAGLSTSCLSESHVPIEWSRGDSIPAAMAHSGLLGLLADDHPQYLLADGVRATADGFAVTGTFDGGGTIPAEGAGTRVMWFPDRAAFRAGSVGGDHWNAQSIGDYSIALGLNTTASATYSVALGREATAATFGAVALGNIVEATGNNSLATNVGTDAVGAASTAMGHTTTANGERSTALNSLTRADGYASLAMNDATVAIGRGTVAMGRGTVAEPSNSVAIGRWNVGGGTPTQWVPTEALLVAGNGSSDANRSNAATLYKNGNLTIAGTLTESSDIRLKTDVTPLGETLERLRGIEPVRYRFREGTGHPSEPQIGLVAQQVEAVFPELVGRDADGWLSIAYPKLTAVLLAALHEQQATLDSQARQLSDQEARVEWLAAQVEELRSALGSR